MVLLFSYSILFYTVLSSNYIIDTPPGQIDDHHVNWAYPIDTCLPNQLISSAITANYKYECKKDNDADIYSVIRNSYAISDTTCTDTAIDTKTFASGTNPGEPGYFICNQEPSEYAIINVYDNDPTCTTPSVPLYTAIGSTHYSTDDLCFNDRTLYVSSFECSYNPISPKDNYIHQMIYFDNQCTNPLVGTTLTSSGCESLGSVILSDGTGDGTGDQRVIYGRHHSCQCNDVSGIWPWMVHNRRCRAATVPTTTVDKDKDKDSNLDDIFEKVFENNPDHSDVDPIVAGVGGFVASVILYGILGAFLFMNVVFCWCYLYKNKDHR